jgi:hypothetical protein
LADARQALRGEELHGIEALSWLNHGPYRMKGVEEPLEICEVGEAGEARLRQPPDSKKAHRFISADSEPVPGWRPAIDQAVPGTGCVLEKKLGEGVSARSGWDVIRGSRPSGCSNSVFGPTGYVLRKHSPSKIKPTPAGSGI